jgi:SAM-dependent methyltransferase
MRETTKATKRRKQAGGVWFEIFKGKGIDVGPGDDPLVWEGTSVVGFDVQHGDANRLSEYFPENHFDFLHASQCLEHMHDPTEAIKDWAKVVKPGGHLVITVPDFVLYEKYRFPSRFNPDHKSTWSIGVKGSWAPHHVNVTDWALYPPVGQIVLARLVDDGYDYSLDQEVDQTLPEDGAECFIEIVIQKP